MSETKLTTMLDSGTQELLMRDAYDAHCRCGRSLTWTMHAKHADLSADAECECGMVYTAWLPTVKIEGLNRNDYV